MKGPAISMYRSLKGNERISASEAEAIFQLMRRGGEIMRTAHDVERQDGAVLVKPGDANFVTVFDLRVQELLIGELGRLFPDARFLAEEKENEPGLLRDGYCFVIDPIDGTTNFIHDMRASVVSVGLYYKGEPVFGAVYNPYTDEMFWTVWGNGAYLNDAPIRVSDRPMEKALVLFGSSPYDREVTGPKTMRILSETFMRCTDLRRSGSATLDICCVACGRGDIMFEGGLSPWDFAAGQMILRQAGGCFTDYEGKLPAYDRRTPVLCTNGILHAEMLEIINRS